MGDLLSPENIRNLTLGGSFGAWLVKEGYGLILGPSFRYIGEALPQLPGLLRQNFDRILGAAARKLGDRLKEDGGVPPRILKGVWEEGPFVEDELAAEYFGGILVASRTPDGKDDSLLPHLAMVKRLSSLQLRLHYAMCWHIHDQNKGDDRLARIESTPSFCDCIGVYLPYSALEKVSGLALISGPKSDMNVDKMTSALVGLSREGLVKNTTFGSKEALQKDGYIGFDPPQGGMVLFPEIAALDLFVVCNGMVGRAQELIIALDVEFPIPEGFEVGDGVQTVSDAFSGPS